MIYDELLKEVTPVALGLSTGNRKFLKRYTKDFALIGGPASNGGMT